MKHIFSNKYDLALIVPVIFLFFLRFHVTFRTCKALKLSNLLICKINCFTTLLIIVYLQPLKNKLILMLFCLIPKAFGIIKKRIFNKILYYETFQV